MSCQCCGVGDVGSSETWRMMLSKFCFVDDLPNLLIMITDKERAKGKYINKGVGVVRD